ncbi:hypothetical protein J3R30DRAFT_115272 [Lentinula aciculospora]|uniref:Uncharacterized protein n=1 Tax=Lentinula aciculospora TaxID=153920 RepID=A0A9W9DXH1_9AGAR|nr:hypothetical protein J3R30DRAFT_115272 [Lentinula aciculospora]
MKINTPCNYSAFIFTLIWLSTSSVAVMTSDAIPFSEYRLLFGLCRDEGPAAHIAVRYKGYAYATLHYDECHPAEARDLAALAELGVFCRAAICYKVPQLKNVNDIFLDLASWIPQDAPVRFGPGDTVTANGTDFAHIMGGSAMCFSPSLL